MKKLLAVAVLFTAFSFTSLDAKAEMIPDTSDDCSLQAQDYGEFMDGYNGYSGSYYALQFYKTFCEGNGPTL